MAAISPADAQAHEILSTHSTHQPETRRTHVKYMVMVRGSENQGPPPPALMQAIGQLGQDAAKDGVFVQMGGLLPSVAGATVRVSRGKLVVTDGPFTETKEVIGGFAIYDVQSKEDALEWTRRFMQLHIDHWPEWEGESEIRAMY